MIEKELQSTRDFLMKSFQSKYKDVLVKEIAL